MKFKIQYYSFSLVMLLILTLCSHQPLNVIETSGISGQQHFNNEDIVFNATAFLVDIVDTLQNNIRYVDGEFLGWPTTINGYEDNLIGIGYRTGFVGIGSFLLKLQELNITKVDSMITQIVDKLLTTYVSDTSGIHWPRFAHATSNGWTALRYGSSGILPFLVKVNQTSSIPELDDILTGAYNWLKNVQTQDGDYPMTPGGYITTDIEYGATGMLRGMLDLYKLTNNETYLNESIEIGTYLLQEGIWNGDLFRVPWTITQESDFLDVSYKSITSGVAGIMTSLIDLFNITEMIEFKDAAIGIANYLQTTQISGGWNDSAVDYVTKMGGNNGLIGYDVGAAGIADSLHHLGKITGDVSYNKVIDNANTAIHSLVYNDGTVGFSEERNNYLFTGFSMGSAGISYYYLKYFQQNQEEIYLENATRILSHLYDLLKNGYIPIKEKDPKRGFAFNIEHGLAGIGLTLIEYMRTNPSGLYVLKYIEDTEDIEPMTSNTNNAERNDFDIWSSRNFIVMSLLWIVMIGLLIRRKVITV